MGAQLFLCVAIPFSNEPLTRLRIENWPSAAGTWQRGGGGSDMGDSPSAPQLRLDFRGVAPGHARASALGDSGDPQTMRLRHAHALSNGPPGRRYTPANKAFSLPTWVHGWGHSTRGRSGLTRLVAGRVPRAAQSEWLRVGSYGEGWRPTGERLQSAGRISYSTAVAAAAVNLVLDRIEGVSIDYVPNRRGTAAGWRES